MPSHETLTVLCSQPLTTHSYQAKSTNRHKNAVYSAGEYCLLEPSGRFLILPCYLPSCSLLSVPVVWLFILVILSRNIRSQNCNTLSFSLHIFALSKADTYQRKKSKSLLIWPVTVTDNLVQEKQWVATFYFCILICFERQTATIPKQRPARQLFFWFYIVIWVLGKPQSMPGILCNTTSKNRKTKAVCWWVTLELKVT